MKLSFQDPAYKEDPMWELNTNPRYSRGCVVQYKELWFYSGSQSD
jgi:hypothetical protein